MDTLLKSVSGRGIATLTFNRPDRANSYNAEMLDALADGFEQFGRDSAVRVIVLRGSGQALLGRRRDRRERPPQARHRRRVRADRRDAEADDRGGAGRLHRRRAGAGELLRRHGREPRRILLDPGGAARLCAGTADRGFCAGHRLPRAAPLSAVGRALLPPRRRIASGWCSSFATRPAIDSVADELIDQLLLGAPGAAANAKRLLQKQAPAALSAEELREMQAAFEAMAKSDEAAEGRAAFKEKRKPRWYPPR